MFFPITSITTKKMSINCGTRMWLTTNVVYYFPSHIYNLQTQRFKISWQCSFLIFNILKVIILCCMLWELRLMVMRPKQRVEYMFTGMHPKTQQQALKLESTMNQHHMCHHKHGKVWFLISNKHIPCMHGTHFTKTTIPSIVIHSFMVFILTSVEANGKLRRAS